MMHGRGWEGAAPESDAAQCGVQLPTRLSFFFFHGFASTQLDSHRLNFYSRRFAPNQDDSAKIKPNRVISAGDRNSRNGRNRPKSALNHAGTAEIGFE